MEWVAIIGGVVIVYGGLIMFMMGASKNRAVEKNRFSAE